MSAARPRNEERGNGHAMAMQNESKMLPTVPRLGLMLPLLALVGAVAAAWLASEACSADAGCVEGAREIWRGYFPDWVRRALRSLVRFVLSPWLWALLAVVIVGERLRPARAGQRTFSTGAVHDVVAWFLMDKLAFGYLFATVFSYSAAVELYEEHLSFLTIDAMAELPQPVLLVLAFVFADFMNWLHHLVRHKVPAFWIFHAVHHSQREMNIFTDDRVHPVEKLIAMSISLIPTLMLGLNVELVPWLLIAQMLYTHAYHGNLRTHYGPLRYVFVTPQSHRVHHSIEPEHADRNFGVIFCIWDRIFGTHVDDWERFPQTGIVDPTFPMERSATAGAITGTYLQQFLYPFRQIWWRVSTGRWEPPATAAEATR